MTFKRCAVVFICILVSLSAQFKIFFFDLSDRLITQNLFLLLKTQGGAQYYPIVSTCRATAAEWKRRQEKKCVFLKTQSSCVIRGTVGKDIQLAHVYIEKQLKSSKAYIASELYDWPTADFLCMTSY